MNSNNQQTLKSYDDHVREYIDGTPQEATDEWKTWMDENLRALDASAKILEFGSAFGRDANYMESLGYRVQRTDASRGFVDFLRKQGHDAQLLDAIHDPLPSGLEMIFASAVLLHFSRDETAAVISKVFGALNDGGRFAFSLKIGDGEQTTDAKLGAPRFFCYWRAPDIEKVLKNAGFAEVNITMAEDHRSDKPYWLLINAIKGSAV